MAKAGLNSRLRFSRTLLSEGVEYWDIVPYDEIPIQPDDTYHRVRQYDTLDDLAEKKLGSTERQWIIAVANGMDIWPTDLIPESTIRIPSKRYVEEVLLKKARF